MVDSPVAVVFSDVDVDVDVLLSDGFRELGAHEESSAPASKSETIVGLVLLKAIIISPFIRLDDVFDILKFCNKDLTRIPLY